MEKENFIATSDGRFLVRKDLLECAQTTAGFCPALNFKLKGEGWKYVPMHTEENARKALKEVFEQP